MSAKIEAAQVKINAIKAAAFQEVGTIAADTAETIVEALVTTKVTKDEIQAAVSAASVKQEA
jgi:F0F1-type ATP synthase membrane subunit b/b'